MSAAPSTPPGPRFTYGAIGLFMIRYGLGSFLIVLAVVLLIVSPGGFGVEGFGLSGGAGSSILMLNFLFRLGVSGDKEREREEEARRYLAEHGRWPDERDPHADEHQRQPGPEHAAEQATAVGPQPGPPVEPAGRQPAGHDHRHSPIPEAGGHGGRRTGLSRDFSRRRRRG